MGSTRHRMIASGMAGYATDGLILFLDGIDNTGNGHNSSATTWVDISGNGHDYSIGTNTFGDDHLVCGSKGLQTSSALPSTYAYMELVIENSGLETTTMFIIPSGNAYCSFIAHSTKMMAPNNTYGSYPRVDLSDIFTDKIQLSWPKEYQSNGTYNKFYLNGQQEPTSNASGGNWAHTHLDYLFCYNSLTDNVYKGKVYAVRVYDRVITEAERIANYNMDKARFNL